MDILRRDYAVASDEDDDDKTKEHTYSNVYTSTKRPRCYGSFSSSTFYHPVQHSPPLHALPQKAQRNGSDNQALPGRYVSKREKARLAAEASNQRGSDRSSPPPPVSSSVVVAASSVVGSISDTNLTYDLLRPTRREVVDFRRRCSGRISAVLDSLNNKAVNSLQWSQNHGHLLASAGMDGTVRVWNVWSKEQKLARIFNNHGAAVKDLRWSPREIQQFTEDHVVETIRFHPKNPDLFLSCSSNGSLKLWDIRSRNVVKEYFRNLGPILDIEFSSDARHFISSSDISRSNVSENAIIVWDFERQVPLSNQVYTEAYTCPCIRYHPHNATFIAQSNGNYIAIFSSRAPFKLDRYKRYANHSVSGFPIKCNFSQDGNEIVSGSADGYIYFYNHKSSQLLRKIKAFQEPCVDVVFHPQIPNVIASCSWNGEISIFD
ncbi:hypothetical protein ZOSMA_442G00030 [Zostera marina]|uniref:Uncharacterized protein n=1 Tax=Zostera marina TaxID=29655 RepID=A0A0K9P168_ZOSMR|nr:hypothetical protein ZOSMA_442G00030 [Zostera marina]